MGMASSQSRFLALTSRKHSIGVQLERYSLEKTSLMREMRAVSKNYNDALRQKTMKWSTNGGASYTDLSYNTLMRPNAGNGYKPILLTNSSDKVVLNSSYKKYASMISADGSAGGTWNGDNGEPRISILSALTGIDPSKLAEYQATNSTRNSASNARTNAYNKLIKCKEKEKKYAPYSDAGEFAAKLDNFNDTDLKKAYNGGTVHIGSEEDLHALFNHIYNSLSKYFADSDVLGTKDKEKFKSACDSAESVYKDLLNGDEAPRKNNNITGSKDDWEVGFGILMDSIFSCYQGTKNKDKNNNITIPMRDTTSGSSWDNWLKEYTALNEAYEASEKTYAAACEVDNEVFNSSEENLIAFYDKMFEAIAEKGWVEDCQVEDNEYMNQMLQNNQYYITKMTNNSEYDENLGYSTDNYKYNYDTDIATNFENIIMVNDQKTRDDALSEYEYEKSIISEKEARVDARMKNLETEQQSIIKMMESIEKVCKDNVETYFKIFS